MAFEISLVATETVLNVFDGIQSDWMNSGTEIQAKTKIYYIFLCAMVVLMFASGLMFTMWFIDDTPKSKKNLFYSRGIFTFSWITAEVVACLLEKEKDKTPDFG